MRCAGLLLLGAALACGGGPPPPPLPPAPDPAPATAVTHRADGGRLFDVVRTLSSPEYGGRRTGSEGGRLTRQWLVERFQAAGLKPVDADYLLPFEFTHYSVRGVFEKDRPFRTRFRDAANVAGARPASVPATFAASRTGCGTGGPSRTPRARCSA